MVRVAHDPKRYHGEPTWDNILRWYSEEMAARGVHRHTMEKFRQSFRLFRSRFEDSTVTPAGLNTWIDAMRDEGYKDSTIEKAYNIMKGLFSWMKRNGIIEFSPFSECRPGFRVQIPDTYIEIEDYHSLKAAAVTHEHAPELLFAIECAWDTGIRISDVCLMRWEYVDTKNMLVTFLQHKLRHRGEKAMLVIPLIKGEPWTDILLSMERKESGFINPWLATQYRGSLVSGTMRTLFDRAGLDGKTYHDFRRSKYSSLAGTKFRLEGCSKVMGSTDPKMFYRYTKNNPAMLRTIREQANQLQNGETTYGTTQEEPRELEYTRAAAAVSGGGAASHPALNGPPANDQ